MSRVPLIYRVKGRRVAGRESSGEGEETPRLLTKLILLTEMCFLYIFHVVFTSRFCPFIFVLLMNPQGGGTETLKLNSLLFCSIIFTGRL